jgi:hypothetical protein
MIPDLKCAVPLQFAHYAVRCGNAMVRCLEDARNLLWYRNREDKEIYERQL